MMDTPLAYNEKSHEIKDSQGAVICIIDSSDFNREADDRHGREIVTACNGREAAIKACKAIVEAGQSPPDVFAERFNAAMTLAQTALAQK